MSIKQDVKRTYDAEALQYLVKRKFYFSYVGVRIVYTVKVLLSKLNNVHGVKVLNVASGSGFLERSLMQNLANVNLWISLDISENMIKMQKNLSNTNLDVIVADAEYLPFRNNAFDLVILSRTIKFMEPEKVIKQIKNITEHIFILFADTADTLWAKLMEHIFNIRVDPSVWNDYSTLSGRNIERYLVCFSTVIKIHITAMPLKLFNYTPPLITRILKAVDKPFLGSRIVCYICLR